MSLLRQIIREINDGLAQTVQRGVEDLSFGDLFGEKRRIVIPFSGVTEAQEEIQDYFDEHYPDRFVFDFENGVVKEEVPTQRGMKTRQTKLGKFLNKELNIRKGGVKKNLSQSVPELIRYFSTPEFKTEYKKYKKTAFSRWGKDLHGEVPTTDDAIDIISMFRAGESRFKRIFFENFPEAETIWQQSGIMDMEDSEEIFRKLNDSNINVDQYNREGSGFAIVVSRDPVDILRMSDFKNIQSCHSEGGGYFNCAVEEAEDGGAVAYVVKKSDLKDIDIQEENLFADEDREIKGISPMSRLRIRRFDSKEDPETGENYYDYSLAAPEVRVYGKQLDGFYESLRDWTFEAQKHNFFDHNLGEIDPPDMDYFIRAGGSYQDNQASELFNGLFQVDSYHGDTDNEVGQNMADLWEEEATEFQNAFDQNAEVVDANYDIDDDGDGPSISATGGVRVELPPEVNLSTEELSSLVKYANLKVTYYISDANEFDSNGKYINFSIDSSENEHNINNPDEYRIFLDFLLEDVQGSYIGLVKAVRRWLIENNKSSPERIDYFLSDDDDDESNKNILDKYPFDNFDLTYYESSNTVDFNSNSISLAIPRYNILGLVAHHKEFADLFLKKLASSLPGNALGQLFLPNIDLSSENFSVEYVKAPLRSDNTNPDGLSFLITIELQGYFVNKPEVNSVLNTIEYVDNHWESVASLGQSVIVFLAKKYPTALKKL